MSNVGTGAGLALREALTDESVEIATSDPHAAPGGRLVVGGTGPVAKGVGGDLEWGSIAFVDSSGLPVPGVEVYFSAPWEETPMMVKANPFGVVLLDRDPKAGFGLALSEGYAPKEIEFKATPVEIGLMKLEDLTIRVRWEGASGAGVKGCEVKRSILVDGYSWVQDLISHFVPIKSITNADGECQLSRDLIDGSPRMNSVLSITNPRGDTVLYTQSGIIDMAAKSSFTTKTIIVKLPYNSRGPSGYTFTFLDADRTPIVNCDVRVRFVGGGDWHGETNQDGTASMLLALRDGEPGDTHLQGAEISIQLDRDRLWGNVFRREDVIGGQSAWVFNVQYSAVRVFVRGAFPQDFEVASVPDRGHAAGESLGDVVMSSGWSTRLKWEPVDAMGEAEISSGARGMNSLVLLGHRDSGLIVGYEVLPSFGGDVTFESPALGLVSLSFPSGQPSGTWSFSLLPALYWGVEGGGIPKDGPPKMDANQLEMRLPVGEYLGSYSRGMSLLQIPDLRVVPGGLVVSLNQSNFLDGHGLYRSLSGVAVEGDRLLFRYLTGSTCIVEVGSGGKFNYSYPEERDFSDASIEVIGRVKWPVEVSFSSTHTPILVRMDGALIVQRGGCGQEGASAMVTVMSPGGQNGSSSSVSGKSVRSLSWGGSVEYSMLPGTYRVIWDVGSDRFEQIVEIREGEILKVVPGDDDLVVASD